MNFDNWTLRASQSGKMMTGKIGITENQEAELQGYLDKIASGKKLTERQEAIFNSLTEKKHAKELPQTIKSFLRETYREFKYERTFFYTNKYTEKGIQCEEDAITLLSLHLNIPLIRYKGDRKFNEFFQGVPDVHLPKNEEGFDVKSSWSLKTFPFPDDVLDSNYEYQNHVYMNLFGAKRWTTAYCLVNATERMVFNEKQKFWYSLGMPEEGAKDYEVWKEICKEVEKAMIFDSERFKRDFPYYEWENEEWIYDIPANERIQLFTVEKDDSVIEQLKERIVLGREYLGYLERS